MFARRAVLKALRAVLVERQCRSVRVRFALCLCDVAAGDSAIDGEPVDSVDYMDYMDRIPNTEYPWSYATNTRPK
jgi:hypothetical protein